METIAFKDSGLAVKIDRWSDGRADVWLDQEGISRLFERDRTVVTKHIQKIYKDGEIGDESFRDGEKIGTSGKNEGKKYVSREYGLDVILSVGYRVNGRRGTEFRRWANDVLGKYLTKGYAVNERVLLDKGVGELVGFLNGIQRNLIAGGKADLAEIDEVLDVLRDYGYSLTTLQKYDEGSLTLEGSEKRTDYVLDYDSAVSYIGKLKGELVRKGEATALFGQEKTHRSLAGILWNVFNAFSWWDAYPSLEEKASSLLYFIVKDHPFNDGNKRVASFLFSLFLRKNDFHLKSDGSLKINDSALAILVVLIAESDPKERDQYVKLLVNVLRKR